MELNEITSKLPPHLLQFVVDQPYHQYTPVDQAVWRYVMRKNYKHLTKVAHESYIDGLNKAGIEIDRIPTMYGMNRILKKIGWAAVAVDGFIPPGAFMEFTAYKVLVIAADIRTLDHIEYTPAPDIIHESAGHAPIIAHPDFAEYLINIGKTGAKAFSSKKDHELYEAIRHLSIIKEDPNTSEDEIKEGEECIAEISSNMGKASEMALLRNLHWWTVEYGLIGSPDKYKIYGAGLLSSIGESESCLREQVKKYPYTIEAAYCNYDITKPQPQLFVTPDFNHLTTVLEEFEKTMAFRTGGVSALEKAIESENVSTIEFESGLQVTGVFENVFEKNSNEIVIFRSSGDYAFSSKHLQLPGHGKENHSGDFFAIVGMSIDESVFKVNKEFNIKTKEGLELKGEVKSILKQESKIFAYEVKNNFISLNGKSFNSNNNKTDWIVINQNVASAFAGPADVEAYQPTVDVPREKTHKIVYDSRTLKLHKFYSMVRDIRESGCDDHFLPKIAQMVQRHFPNDWLLNLEILELAETRFPHPKLCLQIRNFLMDLSLRKPEYKKLIEDGIELID